MKLSELKALGYEGILASCDKCKRNTLLSFDSLPDEELADVKAKLKCTRCGERPTSSVKRDETRSMRY